MNFYPIGAEKSDEGIANVAMGLGKYIMDGGKSIRFSAFYPQHALQLSSSEYLLRETQTYFNALDLSKKQFVPQVDDGFNLLKIPISEAESDGTLQFIASTYDSQNSVIHDSIYDGGRKLITFANILKHNVFPLADILKEVMKIAQAEMGRPIEIEFAVNLDYSPAKLHTFFLLQIRPIVDNKELINEEIGSIPEENTLISCKNAMGHGVTDDLYDLIYVKTEAFNASKNELIASEIDKINRHLVKQNRNYILIGPGRWGSADSWLGIPVKWPNISNARLIVESGLANYRVDPSQGTHFFQNLTSFGVAYFTINPFFGDGTYDIDFLNSQSAEYESEYIRHIHFLNPILTKVDGRKSLGVVMKPYSSE